MNNKITTSLVASFLLATNLYSAQDLETISVTSATKSTQLIKDVTSDVEVITSAELEERNYSTVMDALNSISGVDITSNGGLGQLSFARINGMHYTNTLVLIDGVRYNDITNGSAFLENVLLSDVKQVEILKGAQSGVWGADASGGVINIITKTSKEGLHGSINAEYGSYNTRKYGADLSYKTQKYYLKLNRQKVTTDGFTSKAPRGEDISKYEDDSFENTTTSLKAGFNINEENKLDLIHTIIDTRSDYDGGFGATTDAQANDSVTYNTSKSKFSKINFNNTINSSKIDIYGSKSSFNRDNNGTDYIGNVSEMGIKSEIKYNKKDFLVVGLDSKKFVQDESYDIEYKNNGIFLTNSNTLNNDNTVFTQSLRYDKYTNFKNKLTGKIGIKHSFDKLIFNSNYGTGYKAPSLYQLSHDGGNDLSPEYTKSFDISGEYSGMKIKLFKNRINDLITYNDNNTGWPNSADDFYENTEGESIIKGYEVSYKKSIIKDTLLTLNYTKLSAKDKDDKTLGRVPEELLKIALDYYGIKKFHFNINAKYTGDRWNLNGEPTGGDKTGRYTVWNSIINYKVNKTFKTYLKVNNLFNKYYQTVEGYATAERSAYIGLKASF